MNFFQCILNFFLAIPRFFIQLISKDSNDAGLSKTADQITTSIDSNTAAVNQEMKKLLCPFDPANKEKIKDFIIAKHDKNLDEIVSVLFDKEVDYETVKQIGYFFPDYNSKIYKDLIEMKYFKEKIEDGAFTLWSGHITNENVDLTMMILKHMSHLKSLSLSGNYIEEADFSDKLSEVLKNLTNLEYLDISMMRITPEILEKLSGGLSALTNLKKLDFCTNPIGDDGATIFATTILPKLTALEKLTIYDSSIGNPGIKAILEGLKPSDKFELDLSSNSGIDDRCKNDVINNLGKFKKLFLWQTNVCNTVKKELNEKGKEKKREVA